MLTKVDHNIVLKRHPYLAHPSAVATYEVHSCQMCQDVEPTIPRDTINIQMHHAVTQYLECIMQMSILHVAMK